MLDPVRLDFIYILVYTVLEFSSSGLNAANENLIQRPQNLSPASPSTRTMSLNTHLRKHGSTLGTNL